LKYTNFIAMLCGRTFLILCALIHLCSAQLYSNLPEVPEGYFRSPVDIKIYLSGTFGEPRSTHFHTGIDIKTHGVEGKKIYSVAEGYVSRVSVSPFGYGNAVYVTHPNGMVSVYGHLQKFASKIQEWVKQQQHAQTNFAINMEDLSPSLFPVIKGEVIAFSGNTGGSGGPHLHFELRDSLEHPLNPLFYGFEEWVIDKLKPSIYNLFFYNLNELKQFTPVKKVKASLVSTGIYMINSVIQVNTPKLGIGVHTIDLFTGTANKNGVYEIKLYHNETLTYHYRADLLSFDYTKHVYSHCDYWQKKNNNTVHKCFREKGNKLPLYPVMIEEGEIDLSNSALHNIRIEVNDFHGNTSKISAKLQYQPQAEFFKPKEERYHAHFLLGQRNQFSNNNVRISLDEGVLFNDLYFQYKERANNSYGPFIDIHNSAVPVGDYFDISIKIHAIDTNDIEKYVIAYYDYKNRKKSIGGKYSEGFMCGETRSLGTYFIDIDTVPPRLNALNISEGKQLTHQKNIQFRVSDSLSGIASYDAFLNGKWVVLTYDAKKSLMTYTINKSILKSENILEVLIVDERGNYTSKQYDFTYLK